MCCGCYLRAGFGVCIYYLVCVDYSCLFSTFADLGMFGVLGGCFCLGCLWFTYLVVYSVCLLAGLFRLLFGVW